MFINIPENKQYYIKHSRDEHPRQEDFTMHAHSHYELLLFISGDITYLVEGNSYHPKLYDLLLFDIAETHKVIVNNSVPYERLVIQVEKNLFDGFGTSNEFFAPFSNRKLGENNLISSSNFRDSLWEKCLRRFMWDKHDKTDVISWLLPLLNDIRHMSHNSDTSREHSPLILKILSYINDNLDGDLSTEKITKNFYINRTELYSAFTKATGTGIHQYITVKRLIMAHNLITQGEKPTVACQKSGFNDYSSFYRAFTKHFGISPKNI